jgi:predicted nucleic acid-binding protein
MSQSPSGVSHCRKPSSASVANGGGILRRFERSVVEITPSLFDAAMRLANTHALRAYDAEQLAAALEIRQQRQKAGLGPVTLISADKDLNAAATIEKNMTPWN